MQDKDIKKDDEKESSNIQKALDAVLLVKEVELPKDVPNVRGYDFDKGNNIDDLLKSYLHTGFQATNIGLAIEEINKMLKFSETIEVTDFEAMEKLKNDLVNMDINDIKKKKVLKKCTIFLGYTSNMISCGIREVIKFIVKHRLVDCIVTTGGGIEEDFMKIWNAHRMGDFKLDGKTLRKKGLNRIGNLIVPNKNYCKFEQFCTPLLDEMLKEQQDNGTIWSPSKMIRRMGKEIDNEDSVYYWAYKNNIPVLCPAITDGSIGDMIYFHSYNKPGLIMDTAQDIKIINDIALNAHKSGMIILGGGIVKHHICNANLMRNGADYSVFINTGQEFDGSDSGAKPDEAISWGKIKIDAKPVKVSGDASMIFPLVVSQTFAKHVEALKKKDETEEKQN